MKNIRRMVLNVYYMNVIAHSHDIFKDKLVSPNDVFYPIKNSFTTVVCLSPKLFEMQHEKI